MSRINDFYYDFKNSQLQEAINSKVLGEMSTTFGGPPVLTE